jgi:RimJ/RimL family protein N-acetyltransferase
MKYRVWATRPEEWEKRRDLRLLALQDPASSVAFGGTYETESRFTDEVWQGRAATPAFIAEDEDGEWVANVVVLLEAGADVQVPQTHLLGVYVKPEHRGTGLAGDLLSAAIDWSWTLPERIERVRLWVHENNPRAQAFYNRLGFTKTGKTMAVAHDGTQTEYEMGLARP